MDKRGRTPARDKPATSARRFSRFLGFIVQSGIIGEIDRDTAAKRIEGLIAREPLFALLMPSRH
jgi:hypothetical protein